MQHDRQRSRALVPMAKLGYIPALTPEVLPPESAGTVTRMEPQLPMLSASEYNRVVGDDPRVMMVLDRPGLDPFTVIAGFMMGLGVGVMLMTLLDREPASVAEAVKTVKRLVKSSSGRPSR